MQRKEFKYDVRIGPDFDSTWLPTTAQTTQIAAGTDWRYDVNTRDFIAARDDVTTADLTYDFTGVELTYDAGLDEQRGLRAPARVAGIFTDIPPSLNNEIRRLAASVTADAPTRFQKAQLLQQWFREDGGFRYDQAQVDSAGSGGADLLAFLDDRVRLLRAVRRVDGDHGARHRHPEPGRRRLPRAREDRQRRVGVLRARPARVARALLPRLRLGALRADAAGAGPDRSPTTPPPSSPR